MRISLALVPLVVVVLLWVTGCDDATDPLVPTSVEKNSGFPTTAEVAQAVAAGVTVLDQNGNGLSGITVSWTVVSGGGTVSPSESTTGSEGVASTVWTLGDQAGEQTLEANVSGLSPENFVLDAVAAPPASMDITPDSVDFVSIGDTVELSASLSDEYGNPTEGTPSWTMAGGETSVAAVTSAGLLYSVGNGLAEVVGSVGSIADTIPVTVDQVPHALTLTPSRDTLFLPDTLQLQLTVTDSSGTTIVDPSVTWSSSDSSVATVSSSGLIRTHTEGTALIRAVAAATEDSARVVVIEHEDVLFDIAGNWILRMTPGQEGVDTIASGWAADWSPDGSKIVFYRDTDIWTAAVDGTSQVNLTPGTSDSFEGSPNWSPDGSKIVFVSDRTGSTQLYVMDSDGSNLEQLTDLPGRIFHPDWSPDGTRIVFVRNVDPNDTATQEDLYLINSDGTGLVQVTTDPRGDWEPSWAPDGTTIAFMRIEESFGPSTNPNMEIYSIAPDGTGEQRLTNRTPPDRFPSFSPNSQHIVFVSFSESNGGAGLAIIGSDGSNLTRVYEASIPSRPKWKK